MVIISAFGFFDFGECFNITKIFVFFYFDLVIAISIYLSTLFCVELIVSHSLLEICF